MAPHAEDGMRVTGIRDEGGWRLSRGVTGLGDRHLPEHLLPLVPAVGQIEHERAGDPPMDRQIRPIDSHGVVAAVRIDPGLHKSLPGRSRLHGGIPGHVVGVGLDHDVGPILDIVRQVRDVRELVVLREIPCASRSTWSA
jgi:hypothetical protein